MEMDRKFMAQTRKSLFRGTISYRRSGDKYKNRRGGGDAKERRGGNDAKLRRVDEGSRERRGEGRNHLARPGRTVDGNLRLPNQLKVLGTK